MKTPPGKSKQEPSKISEEAQQLNPPKTEQKISLKGMSTEFFPPMRTDPVKPPPPPPPPPALSLENLYDLDESSIGGLIKSTFTNQIQGSSSVRDIFFAGTSVNIPPKNVMFVDQLASALISQSIARTSLHGFSKTVDLVKCDNYCATQLNSTQAEDESSYLYDYFFPSHCSKDGHSFQDYLVDSKTWAGEFKKHLMSDDFVNITIQKLIAGQSNWLYQLNVALYKLDLLDSSAVAPVLACWQKAWPDKAIDYNLRHYKRISSEYFKNDEFLSEVIQAISVVTTEPSHNVFVPTSGGGGDVMQEGGGNTYGQNVAIFLKLTPTILGLTTGQNPDNFESFDHGSSGCFIDTTQVLLEDGKSIPIKDVAHKHKVIARDGAISIHTDEKVINEVKQDMIIYGFNEEKPFFTAGHLFWTAQGWKAIDIRIALEENPNLEVSALRTGDHVERIKSLSPVVYEKVKINKFSQATLAAGSKIYGLHLHEGPASYHANGYCVRMNYPFITEKRLLDGFSRLSTSERQLILKQLTPIMPLLKKAVGSFIEGPLHRSLHPRPAVSKLENAFTQRNKDYNIRVFDQKKIEYSENKEISIFRIRQGKFILDDEIIISPKILHNVVSWSQLTKNGYTAGVIHFTPNGLAFSGKIAKGRQPKSAVIYEISGITPASIYTSTVNIDGTPTTGISFSVGYKYPAPTDRNPNPMPISVIKVQTSAGWQGITRYTTPEVNPDNQNLILIFGSALDPDGTTTNKFLKLGEVLPAPGNIEFAWDGNTFSGTMNLCGVSDQPTTPPYACAWNGVLVSPTIQADEAKLIIPELLPMTDLSVMDLITLATDQQEISSKSNDLLKENMEWAIGGMDNNWLTDFMGRERPVLSTERQNLINQSLSFYQDNFAVAYLGWGVDNMAGPGAPSHHLSDDEKLKLKYYLYNGLAQDPQYTIQTTGIFNQAYIQTVPRIQDYIDDGGEKWAQAVYDELTTVQQINIMQTRIIADPVEAMTYAKKNSALLSVLQPSNLLAGKYFNMITQSGFLSQLEQIFTSSDPSATENIKTELLKWIPDFIKQFIDRYINDPSLDPNVVAAKEAAQNLQKILDEAGDGIELTNAIADFVVTVMSQIKKGGPAILDPTTLSDGEKAFSEKYPKFVGALKFLKTIAVGFAIYELIGQFNGWTSATDAQRASLIISTLALVEPVLEIMTTVGDLTYDAYLKITQCFSQPQSIVDNPDITFDNSGLKDFFVDGEIEIPSGSLLGSLFAEDVISTLLKGISPIVSLATAGLSLYNFIEDIKNGVTITQEVMDGIIAIAALGVAICEVATIVGVESIVVTVGGPLGAIVGIVFALVELFLPKPTPESPADKLLDTVRQFLASQSSPPSGWTPPGEKTSTRLISKTTPVTEEKSSRKSRSPMTLFSRTQKPSLIPISSGTTVKEIKAAAPKLSLENKSDLTKKKIKSSTTTVSGDTATASEPPITSHSEGVSSSLTSQGSFKRLSIIEQRKKALNLPLEIASYRK